MTDKSIKIALLIAVAFILFNYGLVKNDIEDSRSQIQSTKALKTLPEKFDWNRDDDYTASLIINTYLNARRATGDTLEKITENVFNVYLPTVSKTNPHSYPFLSGDTLRSFSDVIFERKSEIRFQILNNVTWKKSKKYEKFKNGTVIFVKSDDIEHFAIEILPHIGIRFILISHNSDYDIPRGEKSRAMLDHPNLIRWFGMNTAINHPKLEPIPIGLENRYWDFAGKIEYFESVFSQLGTSHVPYYDPDSKTTNKSTLAYLNFSDKNNAKVRSYVRNVFKNLTFSKNTLKKVKKQTEYIMELVDSNFVVSPPGNGQDCHRTWESILFGSIPIVQNSTLYPIFKKIPCMVVTKDWNVTESKLRNFRVPVKNRNLLMAQYWFDVINSYRNK